MKCLRLLFALLLLCSTLQGQPIARTTIAEHFTNTWCSICAGRNPGFYSNLTSFPGVLHIAYYPSAPYAGCPFNQLNKAENDARTNFYGIYGSTPRLVINGVPASVNADFTSPAIFGNAGLSDYSMRVQLRRVSANIGEAAITVKKVAGNNLSGLRLFAVVSEDTVHFNAKNGETVHYDLFHKSLTGSMPQQLSDLASVDDSITNTYSFAIESGWGAMHVTAILQDSLKNGLQAARSARLAMAMTTPPITVTLLGLHPNPAHSELWFSDVPMGYHNYIISNSLGQVVRTGTLSGSVTPLPLIGLQSGFYVISLSVDGAIVRGAFVKD